MMFYTYTTANPRIEVMNSAYDTTARENIAEDHWVFVYMAYDGKN